MTHFRKMLPAALAVLLLLSACELVNAVEVAVSGPECGRSGELGYPPELAKKNLYALDPSFDWDRLDEMIAVLESYEDGHGPDVRFSLGISYIMKASTLSDDPAYYRRGVRMLRWAALCGVEPAVELLSGVYREGFPGVDKDSELAACLDRSHDPLKHERALIPGRVWGCGLRVEDLPE